MPRCIHIADIFEIVADAIPDRPALITDVRTLTYAQLDERITRLANHLATQGVRRGDHVAVHATNCPEWIESFLALFKLGAAAVNVNYRYVDAELKYLYENADCVMAIAAPEYADRARALVPRVLVIGADYESAIAAASPIRAFEERLADDHYVLYTGGTTGMPKGVIWRQEDIVLGAMNSGRQGRPIERPEQVGEEVAASEFQLRMLVMMPLMHGGGQWVTGNAILMGAAIVLHTAARFEADAVWQFVAAQKVNTMSVIGDAMARPLAEALLAPGAPAYDLSSLFSIGNGGAALTAAVRAQLRDALPNLIITDSFGASETGAAGSKMDGGEGLSSPKFSMGPHTTVLNEQFQRCAVGEVGKLARTGNIPLRYHKDPEKTAATFPTVDGVRWVIPGDFAVIEDDGEITLLGRGSVCINSGGEKIFPEEVEAALKHHRDVFDAVVVGTPNQRWGEQVTALVHLRPVSTATADEIAQSVRAHIADYKAPKAVFFVAFIGRTPVGKIDYPWAKATALEMITAVPAVGGSGD